MQVENISGKHGVVRNQFNIIDDQGNRFFQSYDSIIVKITHENGKRVVYLDKDKWDYSNSTGKYRNIFLGETKKETEAKIKSGEYILTNLN
jgi:hypothetical protein